MRIFFLLFAVRLAAQVQGPQLGYAAYKGELRRIEGLSTSSRLSEPLLLSGCSRIDAASSRWALCATESETLLVDLRDLSTRTVSASPFEKALWSPRGEAVVVDRAVKLSNLDAKEITKSSLNGGGTVLAISDKGAIAQRDSESGRILLDGESIQDDGSSVTAAAFDGDALLLAMEARVARVEAGKSAVFVELPIAATALRAGPAGVIYACNSTQLVRVEPSESTAIFDLPAAASRLDILADGSLLIVSPALEEPGWLFRWRDGEGGAFFFIPGFPAVREVVAQ